MNVVQGRILADDRRVYRKVWNSSERKAKLPDAIFDGFRIAWLVYINILALDKH